IAVAGIGNGAPSTPFTIDRARVKAAINRMVGQKQAGKGGDLGHNIGLAEVLQIDRGDIALLQAVTDRECQGLSGPSLIACAAEVEMQVRVMAVDLNREGDQTVNGLRSLFLGLRAIEGPKTLIFVSEGFIMTDTNMVIELGSLAAASRTT